MATTLHFHAISLIKNIEMVKFFLFSTTTGRNNCHVFTRRFLIKQSPRYAVLTIVTIFGYMLVLVYVNFVGA